MFAGIELAQSNPRRTWTALLSFTFQAAAVATLLTLPLFYPQSLPESLLHARIFVPMVYSEMPVVEAHHGTAGGPGGVAVPTAPIVVAPDNGIHFPGPKPSAGPVSGPPNLPLGPGGPGVLNTIPGQYAVVVPPPMAPRQPRISVMMQGNLIHKVEPLYPAIAKIAGVQGPVLVKALISREGRIAQEQVVSGSRLLAPAALDAIRQWRYRPYYLNGEPVEVETEITVNFVLQR